MSYATLADMVKRFGQRELVEMTDTTNLPPSVIDEERVQQLLDDASATVDSYVGQVYALPLRGCVMPATVPGGAVQYATPPQLVQLCCDLARPGLYAQYLPDEHEVSQRHKRAIKALESLAVGKTVLACPWGGEPGDVLGRTAQTEPNVSSSFGRRSVTDEDLRGF